MWAGGDRDPALARGGGWFLDGAPPPLTTRSVLIFVIFIENHAPSTLCAALHQVLHPHFRAKQRKKNEADTAAERESHTEGVRAHGPEVPSLRWMFCGCPSKGPPFNRNNLRCLTKWCDATQRYKCDDRGTWSANRD